MRSKETIIVRFLIEHKREEVNVLAISKAINMDYKNTHSIIERLEKISLVQTKKFGPSRRVMLKRMVHPLVLEAELERRNDILKDKNLSVMAHNFKRGIQSAFYVLLLFGSYAKKTQTRRSDIDVMFICPDGLEEWFEKEVSRIAHSMPLPLHPLVFSQNQFVEMIHARQSNVGQEAFNNNIILYGIEQFYEMV